MRGQTHLKTVKVEEAGEKTRGKTIEARPAGRELGTRSLPALFNEMERFMEDTFHRPFMGLSMMPFRHFIQEFGSWGEFSPSVDIYEESGNVLVRAELPGMKREDINLQFVDNTLVISGEKRSEQRVEEKDYLRLERSHGSFRRSLLLPDDIDVDHAKASLKEGILEVRIPKIEGKHAVRKIAVE